MLEIVETIINIVKEQPTVQTAIAASATLVVGGGGIGRFLRDLPKKTIELYRRAALGLSVTMEDFEVADEVDGTTAKYFPPVPKKV